MIKSFSSEKNVFAVTGENKNIIWETGKGTQSARTRSQFGVSSQTFNQGLNLTRLQHRLVLIPKCQFSYPFLYFNSWKRFCSYIPSA